MPLPPVGEQHATKMHRHKRKAQIERAPLKEVVKVALLPRCWKPQCKKKRQGLAKVCPMDGDS